MNVKLNRIDYLQVGLTSRNTLKSVDLGPVDKLIAAGAVVGDHTGSVHCFAIRNDSTQIETIFKTLPGPNAKISCVQVVTGISGTPKILVAFGFSIIKGFSRKGKQFFGLELNNLTEPIKHLQLKWPTDIFICGQYIYNHYVLNPEPSSGNEKTTVIQAKDFYIAPSKITGLIILDDNINRKLVSIISCEDRLIRVIKDSNCQYEIETNGIPSCLYNVTSTKDEYLFCYGTLEGRVSLISLNFSKTPIEALHKWEIPEKGNRSPVACISLMEKIGEIYIGRSDGTIEIWIFIETLESDGNRSINFDSSPIFRTDHNCGEGITSITVCREGTLLLCCTFTGVIFGLTQSEMPDAYLNSNIHRMNRELEVKVENLRNECELLEKQLAQERKRYQELTSSSHLQKKSNAKLSALPYFATNDSFILQQDASYLLTFEVEVAIDSVIIQCDIPLDLIDCEKNSAVISYNDNCTSEVLTTFRCQANTTRLEIKIRPIEGQSGILRVYTMTRMTPKSCQVKHYHIRALSLHRRIYTKSDSDSEAYFNTLHLFGDFSLNESHNWLQMCLVEIPDRSNIPNRSTCVYSFISTLTDTVLIVECSKGSLIFKSDNVSTISILKDFITREATKKSIAIEMNLNVNEKSLGHTIRKIHPKLKNLLKYKKKRYLDEAIRELSISDPELIATMNLGIKESLEENEDQNLNIERLYGLIADLFIDYLKLEGTTSRSTMNNIKRKLNDFVELIETYATDDHSQDVFVEKVNDFWGLQSYS